MVVRTITVTREAYDALHGLKAPRESFSETILRVVGKRSLDEFIGVLSGESADKLERAVHETRVHHTNAYRARVKRVAEAFRRG